MKRFAISLLVVGIVVGGASWWGLEAAVPPDAKCQADKLKAAGKKAQQLLKCHSKAIKDGLAVDAACVSRAEEKFLDAFGKAEEKATKKGGQCETVGDAAPTGTVVDEFVADVVAALAGGPSKCLASKFSTTGLTVKKLLNLYAKDKKKSAPEKLAARAARTKDVLSKKFEKAEEAAAEAEGVCPTVNDDEYVQQFIDEIVAKLTAALYPWPRETFGIVTVPVPVGWTAGPLLPGAPLNDPYKDASILSSPSGGTLFLFPAGYGYGFGDDVESITSEIVVGGFPATRVDFFGGEGGVRSITHVYPQYPGVSGGFRFEFRRPSPSALEEIEEILNRVEFE